MKSRVDWVEARLDYEVGHETVVEISRKFNVSRKSIYQHMHAENWSRDLRRTVQNAAYSKVASGGVMPRTLAEAATVIEQEATKVAELIARHRDEWHHVRVLHSEAVAMSQKAGPDGKTAVNKPELDAALKVARLAKVLAEGTKLRQDGERRAWGLEDSISPTDSIPDSELDAAIEEAAARAAEARGRLH